MSGPTKPPGRTDVTGALDTLIGRLAQGEAVDLEFDELHRATADAGLVRELGQAYEQATREHRMRRLERESQAALLLMGARFFADVADDVDSALGYAERAMLAWPSDVKALNVAERLLLEKADAAHAFEVYRVAVGRQSAVVDQVALWRRALKLLGKLPGANEQVLAVKERIVKLEPQDAQVRAEVAREYATQGRFGDLAKLIEDLLKLESTMPVPDATELRLQLVSLYRDVLRTPQRAMPHLEQLLTADPVSEAALKAGDSLVDSRLVRQRLLPLLADAYERLGRPHDELALLTRELKVARPPRLAAVQRRVGLLKLELFDDAAGALELLSPLVASDPGDDLVRRRYIELCTRENRASEALRLVSRALGHVKDDATRARVGHDVGNLHLALDDAPAAQAAFEQVVKSGAQEDAVLASARRLVELLGPDADPKKLARALHAVTRMDPDQRRRHDAAKRLAELSENYKLGTEYELAAWRALIDSIHGEQALVKLEELSEKSGDKSALADVLSIRAKRTKDPEQARALAFRSVELRAQLERSPNDALELWRRFVQRHGSSRQANAKMAALLERTAQWEELCGVLEEDVELAPAEDKAREWATIGQLRLDRLRDRDSAVKAFRVSLEHDSAEPLARSGLERLLADADIQLEAADALEPIYENEGAHEKRVQLLEIRAARLDEPAKRLECLEKAAEIVERELGDTARGIELCGRALHETSAADPAALRRWLERLGSFAKSGGHSERTAEILLEFFGESDRLEVELAEFVVVAAEALAAAGNTARARFLLERALAHDPTSPELLARLDALSADQGTTAADRIARYRRALDQVDAPDRKLALMHSVAEIERAASMPADEVATLREIARLYPSDARAHERLLDAFERLGDESAIDAELERGLACLEGAARQLSVVRSINRLSAAGEERRAVELCRALLDESELEEAALDAVERTLQQVGDVESLQRVLERRVQAAPDAAKRAEALERSGNFFQDQLGDSTAAAEAWRSAARLCRELEEELERECRLYERVLDAFPNDQEAASRLVELYAALDNWAKVPEVYALCVRLEESDGARVELLLALAPRAAWAGATDEFVALADEALWRIGRGAGGLSRKLIGAKVSVLAADRGRQQEAGQTFRSLVESYGDEQDVSAYLEFVEKTPDERERRDGLRWIYQWRASRASKPLPILFEWADVEERRLLDIEAASGIYERIVSEDPRNEAALEALVRLRREQGQADKAVAALERWLGAATPSAKPELELRIAELLLDPLNRPRDALARVASVLDAIGLSEKIVELSRRLLAHPDAREPSAELLERVASNSDPAEAVRIFEFLLEVTAKNAELARARMHWYERLLALAKDEPRTQLSIALRAAAESPDADSFWTKSEELGRELAALDDVGTKYHEVLETDLTPAVAESVGARAADFFEQTLGEPSETVAILQRVLALSPKARWALDRVKLTLTLHRRHEELLELYDRAVEAESDPERRAELLDEAVLVARASGNEPNLVIRYLEQLSSLRPSDARIGVTLERLYERQGETRKLIELLQRRVGDSTGPDRAKLNARIAGLWVELGEPEHAVEAIEAILGEPEQTETVCELLERTLKLTSLVEGQPLEAQRAAQRRAAEHLSAEYARLERPADIVRVAEIELELCDEVSDKAAVLEKIVSLRLETLADEMGAFDALCALVRMKPEASVHRVQASVLAGRLSQGERLAEVLVTAAEETELQRARLLAEAAQLYVENLGDRVRAIELYQAAFEPVEHDAAAVRQAGHALEALLKAEGRNPERCSVLERLATISEGNDETRVLLSEAARVAFEELDDAERAARNWRALLADAPEDRVALDGLIQALRAGGRSSELARALETRARLATDPQAAKRDRVRVANLYAEELDDSDAAIQTWLSIRSDFGPDRQSFEALCGLYEAADDRDRLIELVQAEAKLELQPERRRQIFTKLAELHSEAGQIVAAVHCFAEAEEWARASEVAERARGDVRVSKAAFQALLKAATGAWRTGAAQPDSPASRAALQAVRALGESLVIEGSFDRAVALYLKVASLPFEREKQRELTRDAAFWASDKLEDRERAIEILKQLFEQDSTDEIAAGAVSHYAKLLEDANRHDDLAALFESEARRSITANERDLARSQWLRAAELWESNVHDDDRAIAALDQAAALGSVQAFESLVRLHRARADRRRAAEALDGLLELASPESLNARAMAAAEAYLELGQRSAARARLERAMRSEGDNREVRTRLAEIYRADGAWAPLADLLVAEAREVTDPRQKATLLHEAARLNADRLERPTTAVLMLEKALEATPDDPELSCEFAELLGATGRHEDGLNVLRKRIEAYGGRRPRERALLHRQLGELLLSSARPRDALSELELAVQIDPSRTDILYRLARLAEQEGQLDDAERTYRVLLLAARSAAKIEAAPTLAEIHLGLSEVAKRRGDQVQSDEFVELALESALGEHREALGLERALRSLGRFDLLLRSVRARLDRTTEPAAAAVVLSELIDVSGAREDDELVRAIRSRVTSILTDLKAAESAVWRSLHRVLTWLGEDSGTRSTVVERWVKSVSLDTIRADELYELAEICFGVERSSDAVPLIERALELDPKPERALAMMGSVLEADPPNERGLRLYESLCQGAGRDAARAQALGRIAMLPNASSSDVRTAAVQALAVENTSLVRSVLETNIARADRFSALDRAWMVEQMSVLAEAAGQVADAAALSVRAAGIVPATSEGTRLLTRAASLFKDRLWQHDRAYAIFAQLIEENPGEAQLWEALLDLRPKARRDEELIRLIEHARKRVESAPLRHRLLLERAKLLLERSSIDAALDGLKEIVDEDPAHVEATELRARLLEQTGRLDELVDALDARLKVARARGDAELTVSVALSRAALLERSSRTEEALESYREVLRHDRDNLDALRAFARLSETIEVGSEELAQMLDALLKVERGKAAADAALRLARIRAEEWNDPAAERALFKGFAADPSHPAILQELTERLSDRAQWTKLADVLERALHETPHDAVLALRLGEAYRKAGQVERALGAIESLEGVENAAVFHERHLVLKASGRQNEALDALEKAAQLDPNFIDEFTTEIERVRAEIGSTTLDAKVKALLELVDAAGDEAHTHDLIRRFADQTPASRVALERLAAIEEGRKNWAEAISAYRRLLSLDLGRGIDAIAIALADACEKADRAADARADLERALDKAPSSGKLRARLRALYDKIGARDQVARSYLREGSEQADPLARIGALVNSGALMLEAGNNAQAMGVLERAHAQEPGHIEASMLLATCLQNAGNRTKALGVLRETAARHEKSRSKEAAKLHRRIGELHLDVDELIEAFDALGAAFELDKGDAKTALLLGLSAVDLDRVPIAEQAFQAVTLARPPGPESDEAESAERRSLAYYHLGRMADLANDHVKARLMAEKAVHEDPRNQKARRLLENRSGARDG